MTKTRNRKPKAAKASDQYPPYPAITLANGTVIPAIERPRPKVDWKELSESYYDNSTVEAIPPWLYDEIDYMSAIDLYGNAYGPNSDLTDLAELTSSLGYESVRLNFNEASRLGCRASPNDQSIYCFLPSMSATRVMVSWNHNPVNTYAIKCYKGRCLYPKALDDIDAWARSFERLAAGHDKHSCRGVKDNKQGLNLYYGVVLPPQLVSLSTKFQLIEYSDYEDGPSNSAFVYVSEDRHIAITSASFDSISGQHIARFLSALSGRLDDQEISYSEFLTKWQEVIGSKTEKAYDSAVREVRIAKKRLLYLEQQAGKLSFKLNLIKSGITSHAEATLKSMQETPCIEKAEIKQFGFRLTTEQFLVEDPNSKKSNIELGPYQIDILFDSEVYIRNLRQKIDVKAAHPHCFIEGRACLGGYYTMLCAAFGTYDLPLVARIVVEFLSTISFDSAVPSALEQFRNSVAVKTRTGDRIKLGDFGDSLAFVNEENDDEDEDED